MAASTAEQHDPEFLLHIFPVDTLEDAIQVGRFVLIMSLGMIVAMNSLREIDRYISFVQRKLRKIFSKRNKNRVKKFAKRAFGNLAKPAQKRTAAK